MSQPAVNITELDGALGVLPPGAGVVPVIGIAEKGPVDAPATFARIRDLESNFGVGPGIEAAAHVIERYGLPVAFVRATQAVAGAYGTLDVSGIAGDSVPTAGVATPLDDYQVVIEILTGGTIGTTGITYRWSLDGGRTWSPETALGTAMEITVPGSGVEIDWAAGDLEEGDVLEFWTSAPEWDTAGIGTALDALFNSTIAWGVALVDGPLDAAAVTAIDTKFLGAISKGKYRAWIGNTRMPDKGETEAAYKTALDGDLGDSTTVHGELCAGAGEVISSVSGRQYRRPIAHVIAAREAASSEEINIADVNLGPLPIRIRDSDGNPKHHDESVNPGLDDSRFTVLRTHEGLSGVYVNRPRLFSPEGSDFRLLAHRRVLNLAHAALRTFFLRRLNKPVRVDKATGFILEADALEIEAGARAALRSVLRAKPKASAIQFALSRTDNLLSTQTMTGEARVVPLAYPETISLDVGFLNPALAVQQV